MSFLKTISDITYGALDITSISMHGGMLINAVGFGSFFKQQIKSADLFSNCLIDSFKLPLQGKVSVRSQRTQFFNEKRVNNEARKRAL